MRLILLWVYLVSASLVFAAPPSNLQIVCSGLPGTRVNRTNAALESTCVVTNNYSNSIDNLAFTSTGSDKIAIAEPLAVPNHIPANPNPGARCTNTLASGSSCSVYLRLIGNTVGTFTRNLTGTGRQVIGSTRPAIVPGKAAFTFQVYINRPPVANALSMIGMSTQTIKGRLTGSDLDYNSFSFVLDSEPSPITFDSNGNFSFKAPNDQRATYAFTFHAVDSNGAVSPPATLTLDVRPGNPNCETVAFGTNGSLSVPIPVPSGSNINSYRMLDFRVQANGSITLLTETLTPANSVIEMRRYLCDGSTDYSLDSTGVRRINTRNFTGFAEDEKAILGRFNQDGNILLVRQINSQISSNGSARKEIAEISRYFSTGVPVNGSYVRSIVLADTYYDSNPHQKQISVATDLGARLIIGFDIGTVSNAQTSDYRLGLLELDRDGGGDLPLRYFSFSNSNPRPRLSAVLSPSSVLISAGSSQFTCNSNSDSATCTNISSSLPVEIRSVYRQSGGTLLLRSTSNEILKINHLGNLVPEFVPFFLFEPTNELVRTSDVKRNTQGAGFSVLANSRGASSIFHVNNEVLSTTRLSQPVSEAYLREGIDIIGVNKLIGEIQLVKFKLDGTIFQ